MTGKNRVVKADGSYTWMEFRLMASFAEDGTVLSVYSILRDISDQVRLQELVDAERLRQRHALDASSDGFAVFRADRDGTGGVTALRLEFINASGAAGFAGDAATLPGLDLLEFFPEGATNGILDDMVEALRTGEAQNSLIESIDANGRRHLLTVQARLDEDSIVSTWRDITEQMSQQRKLADANAETDAARAALQAALNATSDGFVVFGVEHHPDGTVAGLRVVHANTAAIAQFALVPGEVVTHDDAGPGHPRLRAGGLWDELLDSIEDVRPRQYRTHVGGPADHWVASFDNTIASDGAGQVVLTFRDATGDERDRRELDDTRRQAEHAANHDPLTELPNRVLLLQRLDDALHECAADERVGVVFCDLDGFKQINDAYGHAAGDVVLKTVAQRLRTALRPRDTAARLSGDEFVIVLRHLHESWTSTDFVQRLTHSLSRPLDIEGVSLTPSASVGVVLADPHRRPATDRSPARMLADADAAMYRSKAAGQG